MRKIDKSCSMYQWRVIANYDRILKRSDDRSSALQPPSFQHWIWNTFGLLFKENDFYLQHPVPPIVIHWWFSVKIDHKGIKIVRFKEVSMLAVVHPKRLYCTTQSFCLTIQVSAIRNERNATKRLGPSIGGSCHTKWPQLCTREGNKFWKCLFILNYLKRISKSLTSAKI